MSEFIAIIPARSGSKSIIDKNLAALGGYPLLAYSIAAARCVSEIGRIIVSTDSVEYAEIAKNYGAEVPFLRPKRLSLDNSTDYDFMAHALDWMEMNSSDSPEYWVHLRPTTPLREPNIIENAMSLIKSRRESTSLRSGHLSPESPFKWLRKNNEGFLMSLDGKDTDLDKYNGPRQDFPEVIIPNGYVDILKSSFIRENKLLHGDKVLAFETPVCNEVDSEEELKLLSFQLKTFGCPLTNFLEGVK